jgi:hypothetical protein
MRQHANGCPHATEGVPEVVFKDGAELARKALPPSIERLAAEKRGKQS